MALEPPGPPANQCVIRQAGSSPVGRPKRPGNLANQAAGIFILPLSQLTVTHFTLCPSLVRRVTSGPACHPGLASYLYILAVRGVIFVSCKCYGLHRGNVVKCGFYLGQSSVLFPARIKRVDIADLSDGHLSATRLFAMLSVNWLHPSSCSHVYSHNNSKQSDLLFVCHSRCLKQMEYCVASDAAD